MLPNRWLLLTALFVATVSYADAATCESLASLALPDTTITTAQTVAAGAFVLPPFPLPLFPLLVPPDGVSGMMYDWTEGAGAVAAGGWAEVAGGAVALDAAGAVAGAGTVPVSEDTGGGRGVPTDEGAAFVRFTIVEPALFGVRVR